MRKFLLLLCVLMVSCVKSPDLKPNDPRMIFMEKNFPGAKVVRDQVAFQINTCNTNIDKLARLRDTFNQPDSRMVVSNKITQIRSQRDVLWEHLNRIDTEIEKGLALQTFNTIDGGGMRTYDLEQIIREAASIATQSQAINAYVNTDYNGDHDRPPRAIPVR